jgi:hypothetical protein
VIDLEGVAAPHRRAGWQLTDEDPYVSDPVGMNRPG